MNRLKAVLVISLFFLTGCGLDVIKDVYADPVTEVPSPPVITGTGDAMIFKFSTKTLPDSTNMGSVYIYYLIYNKESTHNTEVSYLSSIATDENKSTTSANQMLSYGYRELRVDTKENGGSGHDTDVFILDNKNHSIEICLTAPGFDSEIIVDDVKIGTPCRSNGKNFEFFESPDDSNKPVSEDDDTKKFDENSDGYYVALFSVFSAFDEDYQPLYSPIHYLGSIKVTE